MRRHAVAVLVVAVLLASVPARAQSCPQPAAQPTAPPDGASGVPIETTVSWNAAAGALRYDLWVSLDGSDPFVWDSTTDTTLEAEYFPSSTSVEWWIVAEFATCSTESQHFHFTTVLCPSDAAAPLQPADGESVLSPITFRWSAIDGASGYRLYIGADEESADVRDETGSETSSTQNLPPGNYVWFVETLYDACDSTWSDTFSFTSARAQNCSTTAPVLTSPANGATTTSPVSLSWTEVPGAIGYQVWAALDDGDFSIVDETSDGSSLIDTGEGTVQWYVVAEFPGCDNVTSETFTFTVPDNGCDTDMPWQISPSDGDTEVPTQVNFIWLPAFGATGYNVWVSFNEGDPKIVGSTTDTHFAATVPAGTVDWAVEATYGCSSEFSPVSRFEASATAACEAPGAPDVYVDSQANSGDSYYLFWSPGLNTSFYDVQESTRADFADASTQSTSNILLELSHQVSTPTRFYYRVRSASSCGLGNGPFSDAGSILILPATTLSADDADVIASLGAQSVVVQKVHVPGTVSNVAGKTAQSVAFTATADKPWMTVSPSSGILPPEGIDLTVTADPRNLPVGSSTATIRLSTTTADAVPAVPVSVNLVAPVTPTGGNGPVPASLFIPAVAHLDGSGTRFASDVRVTNTSPQSVKYLLNYTPTQSDGTKTGQQATIQIDPGTTVALDDVLKNFYGLVGEGAAGVLEIRPLPAAGSQVPTNITFASSRTFATGTGGTYGQFIPAIPFSQFVGKGKVLSLQQLADSPAYRTNLGVVEGAGEKADVLLSVFGDHGEKLGAFPLSLMPGEHLQLNRFLSSKGITNVSDARIEVSVTSTTGKVTAYASVLDNKTSDPMLVMPVDPSQLSASRYILPGIADLNNAVASWRSDIRLFNAGRTATTATLSFYPSGAANQPLTKSVSIAPGEVKVIDNSIQSLFGKQNLGGSMLVSTPSTSQLVATARTYNQTAGGTYGQFIPGVTAGNGIGMGERALQILQVEESDRYRTNVGVVELTGNPVTVEIAAFPPDAKVAAKTQLQLAPNEFRQINGILRNLGLPTTYNARVTLKVVGGNGRITGYGSLIDNKTQDPTYVPAQ